MPLAKFKPGDVVQRVNEPEAIGIVREARRNPQSENWDYLVQFGAQLRAVPEEALQQVVQVATPWEALTCGSLSGKQHFVSALTFHRLQNPPARMANSFATTRTQFYPHQFKPLLKFLDHPGKRLLIADDVGLGKTIEAGYILRELEAQQMVERILVVVPARLTRKWKREMKDRFQDHFEIIKGSDLARQAQRLQQGRELEPFKWIVSYESVRPEEIRLAVEETQLPIDLLIADEAHRMRNPETLQHKVGSILCRCADTVLFLSATPVQNKLEDLWHLLRMLSPEEFTEWGVFTDQMEANRLILRAQRALAADPPDLEKSHDNLEGFARAWARGGKGEGEFLRSVLDRTLAGPLSRRELVELQADMGRLSPTAHIICRTRKAEAMTNAPVRVAIWKPVLLTPPEREIYDSVAALCRMAWTGASESWGFQMSLLMAYRVTASCIPAAIPYFKEKLGATEPGTSIVDEIEEDEEGADHSVVDITAWTGPPRERLEELVEFYEQADCPDSKLEVLIGILSNIWREDDDTGRRHRKIVVFSFFLRTLGYLRRQLQARSIPNRMIHGKIPVDDREDAIEDFLELPDINVLLTSEVGGEGIDLQKASVLVNYDLPWNPMVVEQRIGRIDRIGQEADRIVILNLAVADSIEEMVLQRLLQKIRIFEQSIGELDPIIGEEVERITAQALRGELSGSELDRAVEQSGNALERRVLEAREMLLRVDGLLAADQALINEINAVIGERQIPAERELLLFLNLFLAKRFPGCQLPERAADEVVQVEFPGPLGTTLETRATELGSDALLFGRRIGTGPVSLTLSREAAYRHLRAELIHLQHPLTRFAVAEVASSGEAQQTAFALQLQESGLPPGRYAFLMAAVHIKGFRPVTKLVAIFTSRDGDTVLADPQETIPIVIEMLERARDIETPAVEEKETLTLRERLLGALEGLKAEWESRERRLDQARREHQMAARQATMEFRVKRARERLQTLREGDAHEFAIRMAKASLEKTQKERDALSESPESTSWGGIEHDELAVGLLFVGEGGGNG